MPPPTSAGGLASADKGEYDRARSEFNRALELGYDRATVEAALAELPVSPQPTATPRPAPTATPRPDTRDHDPNIAAAYINRGVAYLRESNYDSAIQAFHQALQLDPGFAEAYDAYTNRGDCLRAQRRV